MGACLYEGEAAKALDCAGVEPHGVTDQGHSPYRHSNRELVQRQAQAPLQSQFS